MKTITFKRVHTASRGSSSYRAEGYPGVLYLAKPAWNGQHPEELVIENVPEPVAKSVKSDADKIAKQLAKAQARVEALTAKSKEAAATMPMMQALAPVTGDKFAQPVVAVETVSRTAKKAKS